MVVPENAQTLDVIIATHNRSALLAKALRSLLTASRPDGLSISITVVDNNSADGTRAVVQEMTNGGTPFPLHYLFESKSGKSHALNTGLRSTSGNLVAMIDDDEEIEPSWFEVIANIFQKRNVDFIGGPCYPKWSATKPDWITLDVGGVVGWAHWGTEERVFDKNGGAILLGGNAVVKRSVFQTVGEYDVSLGRTAKGLLSCEDADMYYRILAAGFHGLYIPSLVIHHFVAPERLKKNYHRHWNWGNGISHGIWARREPTGVVEIFGIPRWKLARGAKATIATLTSIVGLGNKVKSFHEELMIWNLMGFIYGRHFCRAGIDEVTTGVTPGRRNTHLQAEEAKQWQ